MSKLNLDEINNKIVNVSSFVDELKTKMRETIIGQDELVDKVLISMLANGHVLLEEFQA